jgi:thiamine biosynthesis lipoprotein
MAMIGIQPATADFTAFGTTVRVAVVNGTAITDAVAAVRAQLAAMDIACSRFRPDSEITAVNEARGRRVTVSSSLLEALDTALRAAALTDGAVTPTVGSAVIGLGYDRDFVKMTLDGPLVSLTRRAVPDWRGVDVRWSDRTVQIPEGTRLDLDATAKALATDRATVAAQRVAACGVLVEIGGDLAVAGSPPPGGWAVWVAESDDAQHRGQTVLIHSGGLATSGTLMRRWRRGGRDLHHLIDPQTALPAAAGFRTATVAAATCVDANIAATAAIVLSDAAGWIAQCGLPARLVGHSGEIVNVAGWPADAIAV